ncbi:hypothetical protein ACMD2_08331 [Ananas comosus]|uniref:Uncharacterized protein n=1 Tax=Ananas comosus TaxID=4615 RepID=A0A199W3N0_ANACO|nr:hypothetical protein ACMD2_08331 [Ananas comosus]
MVSTMIVAAPAQNNSVRTRREEAKLRRTIRDIVWERRVTAFNMKTRQSQMNAMAGDFSDKGEGCSSSSFRSQKPKDIPLPYASNKEDADDDDNASASDDSSSSSQSGRTSAVSKALEELVEIGRRQQEIAKELLNRQLAGMPKHDRCIFMNLKGPILHAWIDRKLFLLYRRRTPLTVIADRGCCEGPL